MTVSSGCCASSPRITNGRTATSALARLSLRGNGRCSHDPTTHRTHRDYPLAHRRRHGAHAGTSDRHAAELAVPAQPVAHGAFVTHHHHASRDMMAGVLRAGNEFLRVLEIGDVPY